MQNDSNFNFKEFQIFRHMQVVFLLKELLYCLLKFDYICLIYHQQSTSDKKEFYGQNFHFWFQYLNTSKSTCRGIWVQFSLMSGLVYCSANLYASVTRCLYRNNSLSVTIRFKLWHKAIFHGIRILKPLGTSTVTN